MAEGGHGLIQDKLELQGQRYNFVVDPPYFTLNQELLFASDNLIISEFGTIEDVFYLHRLDSYMTLSECEITVNECYDHSKGWTQRNRDNDKTFQCEMKPIDLAKHDFQSAEVRKALINTSDKRQLNVTEINLGNIKPTDGVLLKLKTEGKLNSWHSNDARIVADLIMPLALSPSDAAEENPGALPDEMEPGEGLYEVRLESSQRRNKTDDNVAPTLDSVYDVNLQFPLERDREADYCFVHKRVYTQQEDLHFKLEFVRENVDTMQIISPEETTYEVETTFVANCINLSGRMQGLGMSLDHELYMVTSDFMIHRNLRTKSKYNVDKRAYIFIIDNCVTVTSPIDRFEQVKDHVKTAFRNLAKEQPTHKFSIYVTTHRRRFNRVQVNGIENSFSSFMNEQPGQVFEFSDYYVARAMEYIDGIQSVDESTKYLLPTFRQAMSSHDNQEDFPQKEYMRQIILVSDMKYIDIDQATAFADENGARNFSLEPSVDNNGQRKYKRAQNANICHNRCYVLSYGRCANIEAARELADTTFGAHRHDGYHRSEGERLLLQLQQLVEFSTNSMPGLEGLVRFDVLTGDGRELTRVELQGEQLDQLRGDPNRIQWFRQINSVADGRVRRITNTWNQIINRDFIHNRFQSVNNETNTYQLIMLVKEKPQNVVASFIANNAENNGQPRNWISELTDERVRNNRHISRGVYRDRIRLDEKYYKYHRRHRNIDQGELIDVGRMITCLSMLTGVASNMVAFVGKEKRAPKRGRQESMEVDDQGGQRPRYDQDNSTNEEGMADMHISETNCGDTVTHTCNTWDEATSTDYRYLTNQTSDAFQMVGGLKTESQKGHSRPAGKQSSERVRLANENVKFDKNHKDVPAKRSRPAGYAGPKVTIASQPAQVKQVVRTYSVKSMGALNGMIPRNEESDLLLSNMANVSEEDLNKIRQELLDHERTQYLKEKVKDKSGKLRNRQPRELLINTLLYLIAFEMVNWEDGQEQHYMRLTRQQMSRNELDGEWFIEFVKKQFETYKIHTKPQHKFVRDNEKIRSILKPSKTHDAQTVMFTD